MVPPTPQLTVFPHESIVEPHERPLHVPPAGTHASGPQPALHVTGAPQLSVVGPHRWLHQLGSEVQSHWFVDPSQNTPSPLWQLFPHPVVTPQLFGPDPQCVTHQLLSTSHPASATSSDPSDVPLSSPPSASGVALTSSATSAPASTSGWVVTSLSESAPTVPSWSVVPSPPPSG
jgi:hypothetical protein